MISMAAFTDELSKIAAGAAEAAGAGAKLVKRFGKPVALMGSGAAAYHYGNKELDKYQLGRRMYAQMEQQGQLG